MARRLPRYALAFSREAIRKLTANQQWFLAFTMDATNLAPSLAAASRVLPPKDRFWADPHVLLRGGCYYVFVEELLYSRGQGRIAVFTIDEDGHTEGPHTVLERPYHLSYPFIFEDRGVIYMIPETSQNQTVELYKCVDFPLKWEFVRNLMEDVVAADCTLLCHAGKWWMFSTMKEAAGVDLNTDLYVHSTSDPLLGDWVPHPRNPVISDARRARPAGPFFQYGGKLYRPSQQWAHGRAHSVSINEIVRLTEHEFLETQAASLLPTWQKGLAGTHTLCRCGRLTIVDALHQRLRF